MDRNFEQEYKKAFEAAKGLHDAGNALTKKQMEIVFPQLAESEDDRIRKELVEYHKQQFEKNHDQEIGLFHKDAIAYLEKQKEPHFTKRNALFDKCVENCDPEVMKNVSDKVEAMLEKEQKSVEYLPKEKVYDIMRNLTALSYSARIPINSDEYGWIHKITEDVRSLLDYPVDQNPAQTDDEREYVKTLKGLVSDFVRDSQGGITDVGYYQRICDWLDGRHIEQKPAEWSENIIQKAVKEVGLTQHQIDWFKNNVFPPKPEWSEEDRLHYANVLEALEYVKGCKSDYDKIEAVKSDIAWLRELPERFNLPPKQEWSEKDKDKLYQISETILADKAVALRETPHCKILHEAYDDMLDWLKSLSERFSLPPKVEWNEKDKLMIKCCERALEFYRINAQRNKNGVLLPAQFDISGYIASPEEVESWLKSLRDRPKQPEVFDTVAFQKGVQEGRRLEEEDKQ